MESRKYKLGKIADFNKICIGKDDTFSTIEYLDTSSITENVISGTSILNISDAPSRAQRKVTDKTIIYSTVRPRLRHYGILRSPKNNLIVSTGFVTIDIKEKYEKEIDARYLYLLLTQPSITEYVGNIADTAVSAYPSINPSDIASITFIFPDIEVQRNIADIWENLHQKIALNHAINDNLEAMAKQLYDYWFVQFDFPNEDGKPYKSSGGEMVWNEKLKREIPKEWEVLNLGQITTSYHQGLIRSNNQLSDNSEFGYLKMGDLDGKGQYSLQKLARTNATSEEVFLFSLHKGDFLINVRNSKEIVGKTCLIDYVEENTLFNHMLVRMSFDKVTSFYMNLLFNTDFMYRAMDGLKQGTTTVIALYQEDLYRLPIVVPTKNVMDTFSIIEKSILNQKELLTNEIISLIKQRDELLPLLMNGQISVNSDLSAY